MATGAEARAGRRRRGAATSPRAALAALERLRAEYGAGLSLRKRVLIERLRTASLARAADVARLHETLCFLRTYPDDMEVFARATEALLAFDGRADLARHREALAGTGIAGTPTRFRFFAPTARWLARRCPAELAIDWDAFENAARLETFLPLLAHGSEAPGLDEYDYGVRGWVERMKRADETDAAFLVRAFSAIPMAPAARDALWDELDVPMVLAPGERVPQRGLDWACPDAIHPQRAPLDRARPDLARALAEPPLAVRALAPREGEALVDLARGAMVTRSRDLDAFAYGDPRDVRVVECGEGLQFACIGVIPERRLLLEAVYAFLTLKNGTPIGYVLSSALYRSAEIAYNVFETYRGAEAGRVYGRVLSMVKHLFGVDSFTIYPYQLGDGNDEALDSGAWWFYQKLGFRPREPRTAALMRAELARMRREPSHRSTRATLARLSRENVYWHARRERDDVIGLLPLANVGIAATRYLAERFGGERAAGGRACAREAARLLGVRGTRGWSAGERLAWERWAPVALLLDGVPGWSAAERGGLARVIRAKGGPRESDFVAAFDAHPKLGRAIRRLAARVTP